MWTFSRVADILCSVKPHSRIMDKKRIRVNRGASAVEATAAIALLLAVAFYVTIQDNTSMIQAQKDARQAMAQLWLENEVALCRVSQPPWVTNGPNIRLSRYTTGGTTERNISLVQVGLAGVGPQGPVNQFSGKYGSGGRGVAGASAERVLVSSSSDGLDGLVFHDYLVTLRVPYALPSGEHATNTYTREHRRVFQSGP